MTILAEVLMSFFPISRENGVFKVIVSFNYPILEPFRRLQSKYFSNMMIDFSPILAFAFLNLLERILIG